MNPNNQLLTVRELAKRWRVTDAYIYGNRQEMELPTIKIGGNLRFALEDILRYEQEHKDTT